MIRVTVWNENMQENGEAHAKAIIGDDEQSKMMRNFLIESAREMKKVHPEGIHMTLKALFEEMEDVCVTAVTLDMQACGLTDELLDNTDVLVWWAHIAHDKVPDALAEKIMKRVQTGMGFLPLHSSHPCKPLTRLLGTTGSLHWREGDFCRVWNVNPRHPIAEGVPASFELEHEEMYGEYFDVPKPDDEIFISWFRGGEVFRSGLTWTRGLGRIFYFQPGHETHPSYHNPHVRTILKNAVRWAKPTVRIDEWVCPHVPVSPERQWADRAK